MMSPRPAVTTISSEISTQIGLTVGAQKPGQEGACKPFKSHSQIPKFGLPTMYCFWAQT